MALGLLISSMIVSPPGEARRSHRSASAQSVHHGSGRRASSGRRSTAVASGRHRGRHHAVASGRHRGRAVAHAAPKPRYAYPLSIFMMKAPAFEMTPFSEEMSGQIARDFEQGRAEEVAARSLARAGVVNVHHLRGGIFWRREPVKYIIVHSTETGIPQGAPRVIESWNSAGRRHPGAQYVVDRDGTIYQAVDPDLATVHVNIFKTLPGINNDNSIGIEMCHAGRQDYPPQQVQSVIRLVSYLQDRYKVVDDNVVTHRYAQQGDHTDPVNFDWAGFLATKDRFRTRAIAAKVNKIENESRSWAAVETGKAPPPSTYLQLHQSMPGSATAPADLSPAPAPNKKITGTVSPARSGLELRGPIEMDPESVNKLNRPAADEAAPGEVLVPAPTPSHLAPAPSAPSTVAPPAPSIPSSIAAPLAPSVTATPAVKESPAKEAPPAAAPAPAPAPAPAVHGSQTNGDKVNFFLH